MFRFFEKFFRFRDKPRNPSGDWEHRFNHMVKRSLTEGDIIMQIVL